MAVTAYGALVSLMHIIDQLHNHPSPPIAIDTLQLQSLTQNITFLLEFLEGYTFHGDTNETDHLASCISEAAFAAEDAIECYTVENIRHLAPTLEDGGRRLERLPKTFYRFYERVLYNCQLALSKKKLWIRPSAPRSTIFYDLLQKVIKDMELIKVVAMELTTKNDAVQDLLLQQQRRPNVSAFVDFPGSASAGLNNDAMVGFHEVLRETMDKLIAKRGGRRVIPIVGMGGIGKTTLSKNLFSHGLVKEHFDICVWVTISQHFNTKQILSEVLSQAKKESREQFVGMSEGEVQLEVYQYLSGRRYLVVMDDMWSIDSWNQINHFFPDNNNGSRVLVTTRLSTIGSQLDNDNGIEMKFLGEDSSLILFSKTVFGEETFPHELEEIGKDIVGGCKGLPLSIVVIGGLLRKLEHTRECWESIRKNINSVVNSENNEHCLKILKMSYNHLPVHLKPCFLYMGLFEEDSEIHVSTLVRLWISEGFLKPQNGKSLETSAEEYLKDLVGRNLLIVHKLKSDGNIKYCKIHDLLREMCLREAQKEKFHYNVIEAHGCPDIHQQRRIVIPKSTSEEKLHDAMQYMPRARTLICNFMGVRLKSGGLMRSFHSINISGKNQFRPNNVNLLDDMFELVNLRYLAVKVTKESEFRSSINLLWNLQTIIVYNVTTSVVNAPAEIWNMPQLRHVHFYPGVYLPDPPSGNDDIVIMENLHTLRKVINFKCSNEVVKRIPNVKKLSIEFGRHGSTGPYDEYYCLNNLELLHKLESFFLYSHTEGDYLSSLNFPQSLQTFTLICFIGFDCEEVLQKTGSLPLLTKLVLRGGFFKTRKWKTVEREFRSLRFLELNSCKNLEEWEMADYSHFPRLEHLLLSSLEELEEIPSEIGEIPTLRSIELKGCRSSAVESLKRIVEEQEDLQGGEDQLCFHAKVWLSNERKQEEALQRLAAPNFKVWLDWGLEPILQQLQYWRKLKKNFELFPLSTARAPSSLLFLFRRIGGDSFINRVKKILEELEEIPSEIKLRIELRRALAEARRIGGDSLINRVKKILEELEEIPSEIGEIPTLRSIKSRKLRIELRIELRRASAEAEKKF